MCQRGGLAFTGHSQLENADLFELYYVGVHEVSVIDNLSRHILSHLQDCRVSFSDRHFHLLPRIQQSQFSQCPIQCRPNLLQH